MHLAAGVHCRILLLAAGNIARTATAVPIGLLVGERLSCSFAGVGERLRTSHSGA